MELDILEKQLVLVCKKPPYNLDISFQCTPPFVHTSAITLDYKVSQVGEHAGENHLVRSSRGK